MKTFESCCKAFHAVEAAIVAHRNSELGVEIQEKTMLGKLSMFMDLDNWPENPDLQGLTEADEKQLREWGVVCGFHDHPDTHSTDIRTLIPQASGHRFHGHPDTFRQAATQDYSLLSTSFFEAKRSSWSVYPCVKSERYYA
ncbi:hypothetical protein [Pseudomonas veronii]